jgi:hypothetical protein
LAANEQIAAQRFEPAFRLQVKGTPDFSGKWNLFIDGPQAPAILLI